MRRLPLEVTRFASTTAGGIVGAEVRRHAHATSAVGRVRYLNVAMWPVGTGVGRLELLNAGDCSGRRPRGNDETLRVRRVQHSGVKNRRHNQEAMKYTS